MRLAKCMRERHAYRSARVAGQRRERKRMAWIWDFWRREASRIALGEGLEAPKTESRRAAPGLLSGSAWHERLVSAGLSEAWATRLAARCAPIVPLAEEGYEEGLVRGAALALEAQASSLAEIEQSLKDVREVERLLGAFSGELEKLDEVLEVLSAYAQRMRSTPRASRNKASDLERAGAIEETDPQDKPRRILH